MSSASCVTFTVVLLISIPLTDLLSIIVHANTSATIINKSAESGHPCRTCTSLQGKIWSCKTVIDNTTFYISVHYTNPLFKIIWKAKVIVVLYCCHGNICLFGSYTMQLYISS